MNITILCVGKIKESFYKEAVSEYSKRLSKYCKLVIKEVDDEDTPQDPSEKEVKKILDTEGERLLKHINKNTYLIPLCIEGKNPDSVELSNKLQQITVNGYSDITFVIGGSLGICDEIKNMADFKLSFSRMTFPHQLMRVILLEQVYRSFRILSNEPYHK